MSEQTLDTTCVDLVIEQPIEGFSPSGSVQPSHGGETQPDARPFPGAARLVRSD